MLHKFFGLLLAATVVIVGLQLYLMPDELARCPRPTTGECAVADAIVVVSGGDTDGRTDEAIELYKAGWAPLVIMSGAAADKSGLSNAAAMKYRAVARGVPAKRILIEERSETTKQNAVEVKSLIRQREIRRIILVTSGYHMRRAQLEFQAQVPQVKVVAHPSRHDKHWSTVWWLTPWGWWLAGSELLKIGLFVMGVSR